MSYMFVSARGFIETVYEELERLENVLKTIKNMTRAIKEGREIEAEDLNTFYETYYILLATAFDLRRAVIEALTLAGYEALPEELEQISIKLFELAVEYDEVVSKFKKATDEEKIELLKSLSSTIRKYIDEITTLIEKLKEYEIG
jgi:MinD-like ATPase involved in chromosome partitioning or flagellar assembly